jgi:hypothetical protein
MDADGVVEVSGAAVNVVNLSTVNGVPFVNGGTVSQNLTVSTLTAGVSLSTLALDVSSISGVSWPVPGYILPSAVSVSSLTALDYVSTNAIYGVSTMSNANGLDVYTNLLNITGDVSFNLSDGNGGGISGAGNDVFLTGVSSINGGTRPLLVTANSVDVVGVNVALKDPGGAGFSVIAGVVQVNGDVGISSIMGLSSINGINYTTPIVSTLTASNFVSTANLSVSSINALPYYPMYNGLATIPGDNLLSNYFIGLPTIPGFTSNAVIQALLQVPDDVTQNWIVEAFPVSTAVANYIGVTFAQNVSVPTTTVSWAVGNANATPTTAVAVPL